MTDFKANAKFLITGEYLVLHGARALALPLTSKFQTLKVETTNDSRISWQAFDENNQLWIDHANRPNEMLASILSYIKIQKPHLFESGLSFKTHMNFSPAWGLGSSSTLISLLAQWSGVNAFELQGKFFKGSGYDVACATNSTPILYEVGPVISPVNWNPVFKNKILFVYLGKKQDSREAMDSFKKKTPDPAPVDIQFMRELTDKFLHTQDYLYFQNLMEEHEAFISKLIGMRPVKDALFADFPGAIKSLGGWGGDFVMAVSSDDAREYFLKKGHTLTFGWDDLIS